MRGLSLTGERDLLRLLRFIPACAGATTWWPSGSKRCLVHPRVRGCDRGHSDPIGPRAGSSPHARVTRGAVRLAWAAGGFIPAYAGSPGRSACPRWGSPAHRRVRACDDLVPLPGWQSLLGGCRLFAVRFAVCIVFRVRVAPLLKPIWVLDIDHDCDFFAGIFVGRVGGVVTEPLPPQSRACAIDALGSSPDRFAQEALP